MAQSKSSKRWLQEHESDIYVKQARKAGYRGRAVYKLAEIQKKYQILKPSQWVVDLGAAPGSWSQYATECLNGNGSIIALDRLPMDAIGGVTCIEGDFTEEASLRHLEAQLQGNLLDVVLSDMAPNASGCPAVDQPCAMALAELALDFALQWLKPGGSLVVKLFHGEGFDDYIPMVRQHFNQVVVRKPKASRPRSRETYCVAKGRY
ncbi:MAG: RlmE family RNA methyltransferase [Gammaproteobacteria bacterium]